MNGTQISSHFKSKKTGKQTNSQNLRPIAEMM